MMVARSPSSLALVLSCLLVGGCEDEPSGQKASDETASDETASDARTAGSPDNAKVPEGCGPGSGPAARAHPGGEWSYRDWRKPEGTVVRLVEAEAEVQGGETADTDGTLARWSEAALDDWPRKTDDGDVVVRTPRLDDEAARAVRLEVVAKAVGSGSLEVIPIVSSCGRRRPIERLERRMVVELPAREDDELASVSVRLDRAARESWRDTRCPGRLERIELRFPDTETEAIELEGVRLLGREAGFPAPAGVRTIDLGGELHPSWYVKRGAWVSIEVEVPPDAELHWHTAAVAGVARPRVAVVDEEGRHELARVRAKDAWETGHASLEPWAGRKVRVQLSTAGSGISVFGSPRIVSGTARSPRTPDVIVYMIDTLRADRLGFWGSQHEGVSSHMDRLAREGIAFGLAISSSPWTKPAIPTILSGLVATTHRVGATSYTDTMPPDVPMLQERFRDAGFRTGSFSSSPLGSTLSGLERGFDTALAPRHWAERTGPLGHPSADQLHAALLEWVRQEPDRPFFAYVHTLEPHEHYKPLYKRGGPKGYKPYDRAIRDADRKLGKLLSELEGARPDRPTLVALVSDHGESFGLHGVHSHGTSLYQAQLHVPLVFWAEDALPPITVSDPVSVADLAPTLVDLLDLEPLEDGEGRSLVPYFDGKATQPLHPQVTAARLRYIRAVGEPKLYALVDRERHKAIRSEQGKTMAFDLGVDPCELRNRNEALSGTLERLSEVRRAQKKAARRFESRHDRGEGAEIDADEAARLRALGYLD